MCYLQLTLHIAILTPLIGLAIRANTLSLTQKEDVAVVMSLLKVELCCRDLLDEDAPGTGKETALSKHERQQRRMQERIAKLEAQNMAEKDWFMQGESGAGLCPTDIVFLVPY